MLDPLVERFRQGDRNALARLLTFVSRGEFLDEIRPAVQAEPRACVVAVTGSAGVGKSTLIGKLINFLRQQNLKVAVLACDPKSPVTGGALLGDRFRMPSPSDDGGVYIRSLATAPGQGAVAGHICEMIRLLDAFGFDVILLETVGAGQGDTSVRELVDVMVLLLQPETGDELQWEKAGLVEVADVIVIHKADLPRAEEVEAQVRSMLSLSDGPHAVVLRVSAKTGEGIEALWEAIWNLKERRHLGGAP
jgi:LAO/AO transport system ATPase